MVTGIEPTMSSTTGSTALVTTHTKDAPIKSDRRSNKPIMEKRRRARINNCLNELKTLILDYSKKDPARHSKLEKADILEKTVKHLQELQRQQSVMQQATDPKVLNKFKAGFTDCANEVRRFPGLEPAVKMRLLQHLNNCLNGVKNELPAANQHQARPVNATSVNMHQIHAQLLPSPPSSPEQDHLHIQQQHQHLQQQQQKQQQQQQLIHQQQMPANATYSYIMSSHIQQTPSGYFLPNGSQVIPTKLANGSIALVLPQGLHKASPVPPKNLPHMANAPMMMSIPSRTASTGSASSNSSSSFEQNLSSPANSYNYATHSPNICNEPMECKHSTLMSRQPSTVQPMEVVEQMAQQPLSLVIKKNIKEEDQPWRPW